MAYAIYLRKSRVDMEAEASGMGETLARHRARLLELAHAKKLTITKIYEEVVSGETITSRPQMQQLLHDVEDGQYTGVLVMEIERLARGDTIDQGIVARAFQFSGTKIVTPVKTYDPENEFDQEYFEFGLYMSRREYKTINRRQQAGRVASVTEGKWISHLAPYGYSRLKLENQKGWTLTPNEHAPIVQDIFRWATDGAPNDTGKERMGAPSIARRLNGMGIPSPGGKDWTPQAVHEILRNPAYAGWVRWGKRKQVKRIQDGDVVKSRPRSKTPDDMKIEKGIHQALVSQEQFDLAQKNLVEHRTRPGPQNYATVNPLAGLVICDQCGRVMTRRPYAKGHVMLVCTYSSCHTVSSNFDFVEKSVLQSLKMWLSDFEQTPMNVDIASEKAEKASIMRSIKAAQQELDLIDAQEEKAYDLVEQGVYTVDVFTERAKSLSKRREDALKIVACMNEKLTAIDRRAKARKEIAPAIRHVLDSYQSASTASEKNDLLKNCVDHIEYHKTTGGRYRESDLNIRVIPKLPK